MQEKENHVILLSADVSFIFIIIFNLESVIDVNFQKLF